MATKREKKYQVILGYFDTKKEAAKQLVEAEKVIADIVITIKCQKFIVDCGTYDKKENAETIKKTLKDLKVKIIEI